MLTTWDQVQEWITENGFKRWVLYRDRSRTEKIIDSNAFPVSDMEDKLAMTEKYLRLAGGNAYAAGSTTGAQAELNVTTEIRLQEAQAQPTNGIGGEMSIGELTRSITESVTKQIRAEMEAQKYKEERAAFEKEKAEFEEEKKSTIGALVHYFAPIGQQLLQRHMIPRVAGVDAEEPVHAAPIVADRPGEAPEHEEENESPFTDEEEAKIFDLMCRFKKIEPDYLSLLESVVKMAESGDTTYTMAKGFLVK